MKLLVGLGNPDIKYAHNRHNVGMMFVDYFIDEYKKKKIKIEEKKMLHATCYMLHEYILAKPQTFMNESGRAVSSCITSYKLQVTRDLLVVHDDLDIPLGKFHIQKGVGPKLHNGIESIEQHLKTKDFWRIRIGVDNRDPEKRIDGEAYVLQNFKPNEENILQNTIFPKILSELSKRKLICYN